MTGDQHLASLDDEIRDHLEREAQELVDRGMTLEAARAAARRRFGNVTLAKENTRAVWYPVWFEQLVQDLRGSVRMLRRSPGFSAVVILTLTLGIGLNTAVFSVVNAVLLRPLSFPHPERMVWLATLDPKDPDEFLTSVDALAFREAATLDGLVAYDEFDGRVTDGATKGTARIATVSEDFWSISGARAEIGQIPTTGEPAVVLSRPYFERRFGANPAVIGRTITVGDRPLPIVAVLPAGFHVDLAPPTFSGRLLPKETEVYELNPVRVLPNGMIQIFRAVGQLKPGVSIDTARAELETIRARVVRERMNSMFRPTLRIVPLKDKIVADARPALVVLFVSVVVVLMVGCANIAALLLARASARHRELAIRTAIGAGRGRMLRQLLVETLTLTLCGGALGLILARAFLGVAVRLIPDAVPRLTDAHIDGRVLAFACVLAGLTALMFGVAPAVALRQTRTYDMLKEGTRTASASIRRMRLRTWLVVGELALTLVLLCAAGLLIKSLGRLTTYPAGFSPEHVLTMTVQYDGNDLERSEIRRRQYVSDVLDRLASAPEFDTVAMTTSRSGRDRLFVENGPPILDQERPVVLVSAVSEGYARAIGMRLVSGRWLTDEEPVPAFVVNETLARRVFGGEDPVGRRLQVDGPPGATEAKGAKFARIVGVAADLKYTSLIAPPEPEMFADYRHSYPFIMTFVARVSGDPVAAASMFRTLVTSADPSQPISDVKTVEALLSDSIAPRRFTMLLLTTFAGFALLLALIGVYGVIAYSVSLRTGEIGLRMALGAERHAVVWMLVKQGIAIAAAGLVIGLAAAFAATRVMSSLLYEVTPTDSATFAVVSTLLFATVVAASFGPAIKAALVDPLVALKYE